LYLRRALDRVCLASGSSGHTPRWKTLGDNEFDANWEKGPMHFDEVAALVLGEC
jgi:hypothetical protein